MFTGVQKDSDFKLKSILVPPLGDTSSFRYPEDSNKYGNTDGSKWNNGFKCNLDSNNPGNRAIKHGYHVSGTDSESKVPGDVTADECSTWCESQNVINKDSSEGTDVQALGQGWSYVYPSCCVWAPTSRDCYFARSMDTQNNISAEWDGETTSIFYPYPAWQ